MREVPERGKASSKSWPVVFAEISIRALPHKEGGKEFHRCPDEVPGSEKGLEGSLTKKKGSSSEGGRRKRGGQEKKKTSSWLPPYPMKVGACRWCRGRGESLIPRRTDGHVVGGRKGLISQRSKGNPFSENNQQGPRRRKNQQHNGGEKEYPSHPKRNARFMGLIGISQKFEVGEQSRKAN